MSSEFQDEEERKRTLLGTIMPKTLAGLAMWLVLIAMGMAASGVVLFSFYQYKLNNMEERIDKFSEEFEKDFEKRSKEFSELVKSSKAEIEKASRGAGSRTNEVNALLEKVGPSVAYITGLDAANQPSVGSGFIVTSSSNESWVITNFHLVAGSAAAKSDVKVRLGTTNREAKVWSWDEKRDLALIIIKVGGLPALEWAASDPPVGSLVWAVGTGAGKLGAAASQGHLADSAGDGLLTDAGVATSSSGGPLLNNDGKVIGVLSKSYAPAGFSASSGWAVPIRLSCQKVLRCPG